MTPEQIKTAVDAAISSKIILTYPQLLIFVLLSGGAAYLGSYLKKKGENLATREDIAALTQQVEDYKHELSRRARVAEVAEFLTHWIDPNADRVKLNGYAMSLSLWLPYDLYCKLASCICHAQGAPTPKQVLIELRKYLLGDKADKLAAENIIHFDLAARPAPDLQR